MIAAPIQKSFFSWSPPLSLIWMYCLLHISSFLPQEATISSNPSDAISSRAALSILWLNHLSVLLWLTSNLWALPVFAWFGTLHWLEKQTLQATRFWETTRKLLLLVSDSVFVSVVCLQQKTRIRTRIHSFISLSPDSETFEFEDHELIGLTDYVYVIRAVNKNGIVGLPSHSLEVSTSEPGKPSEVANLR